jgi:hypothetical protein
MSSDKIDVNEEEIEKATISVSDEGLEKGTIQCDSCNMPSHMFLNVEVSDEHEGKFVEERWCPKCLLQVGEQMRDQKEYQRQPDS